MIIRRIGVLSTAKISAAIHGAIGLIAGLFVSLFSLLGALAALGGNHSTGDVSGLFGVGSIILLPMVSGLTGFISGAISAFVYNIVAGFIGGIELEVE